MESKKSGWWLFGLPVLICLPCLLPFIAGAVLAGVGAGAVGSFLSDNAFLLALLAALATLVALVVGLAINLWRRRAARSCGVPRPDAIKEGDAAW